MTKDDNADTFKPTPPDKSGRGADTALPRPGLLLVFAGGAPRCVMIPLEDGKLELGRGKYNDSIAIDHRMSRRHASVRYDGQCFHIEDLGSQNGTFVDGAQISSNSPNLTGRVLRVAETLFLLCADLRPYQDQEVQVRDGLVMGPANQAAYEQARRAARFGEILHITGESGAGKEGLARAFHATSPRSGPFVAINCATIAEGVAERLLFGARRGAFSGAVADSEGLIHAAHGGTLFLDEVAELSAAVQAKLLRVIESHEVMPLGANKPVVVHLHLCSATHKDLRAEVSLGRFRQDLYFRISRPKVALPPLRQRLEEIPWLLDRALKGLDACLEARSSLVEQCLLRYWPGNVRELLAEVRTAGLTAMAAGKHAVERVHLCEEAGLSFAPGKPPVAATPPPVLAAAPHKQQQQPAAAVVEKTAPAVPASPAATPVESMPLRLPPPLRETVVEMLRREDGNISATARALGLHRTQLKRLMERYGLSAGRSDAESEPEPES